MRFAQFALVAAIGLWAAEAAQAAAPKNAGSLPLFGGVSNLFASKKTATPVKRSGTTAVYSSKPQPKQEKPGFWDRLFGTEPPPPPKTINEWMKLEQIHPSSGRR